MGDKIFPKRLQTILTVGGILFALVLLLSIVVPPTRPNVSVRVENTAQNLKGAIKAYHTEYTKYPIDSNEDTTVNSDAALMSILFGDDSEIGENGRNPRKIAFFSGRVARPMPDNRLQGGVHLDSMTLWDLWGNHYRVRMDNNHDNQVANPNPADQTGNLPHSIIVWSAGKDGDFDTWKDNVKTW